MREGGGEKERKIVENRERAREKWGEDKKARGERREGRMRERQGKEETTDNPLLKICTAVGGLSIGQF